jgi:hypothetical protein
MILSLGNMPTLRRADPSSQTVRAHAVMGTARARASAHASRARTQAVHARARVKLRGRPPASGCAAPPRRRSRLALASRLGAVCFCCSVPRLSHVTASERSSVRALSTSAAVNPPCASVPRAAPRRRFCACTASRRPVTVAGSRVCAPSRTAAVGARESAAAIMAVVDQVRIDRGHPRPAGTRQRRAREAVEGRRRWGHGRGDDRDGAPDGGRDRGRRAPRARERSGGDVRRDARVTHRPRAARARARARPPARGRPRRAPDEAGTAPARRPAPRTAARALSSVGDRVLPAASRRRNRAAARPLGGHRAADHATAARRERAPRPSEPRLPRTARPPRRRPPRLEAGHRAVPVAARTRSNLLLEMRQAGASGSARTFSRSGAERSIRFVLQRPRRAHGNSSTPRRRPQS